MLIYNSSTNSFWFREGAGWVEIRDGNINELSDADGDTKVQVEESPDDDAIRFDINGVQRLALELSPGGTLRLNTLGSANNLFIGRGSGQSNTSAHNTFVGQFSGSSNTTGISNTFLGDQSGRSNSTGDDNVFLGRVAGDRNESGSSNTYVGHGSGLLNISGSGNVFIGKSSGNTQLVSNTLFIENSSTASPLIYGEFDNDILGFNGDVAIGHQAPVAALHIRDQGTVGQQTIVAILESNNSDRPTLLFSEFPTSTAANGMSIEYNGSGTATQGKFVFNGINAQPLFEMGNDGRFRTLLGDIEIRGLGDRHLRISDSSGNSDRVIIRQNSTNDMYFGDCDDN